VAILFLTVSASRLDCDEDFACFEIKFAPSPLEEVRLIKFAIIFSL